MKSIKIKATPNFSKRTFTIRKYFKNELLVKYRTSKMTKEEFESEEMNTQKDWENFLRYGDYYKC
jgi:hypothetical protein